MLIGGVILTWIQNDPWEIKNLARGTIKPEHQRLLDRLNAILLVTKSCQDNSCRDPWSVLQPPSASPGKPIGSLTTAMNPKHNKFFASLPQVHFKECMEYQSEDNEKPFYPPGAENGLGKAFRLATDDWVTSNVSVASVAPNAVPAGGAQQRHATPKQLMADTHKLSDAELGNVIPREWQL